MSGKELRVPGLSIGILAGGKSLRMGQNKALLPLDGDTMAGTLVREFSGFSEILLSAAAPGICDRADCRMVYDEHAGTGPLEGIRRILQEASEEYVFICAADMPFLKKELVRYMLEFLSSDYDCWVIRSREGLQPLCAIWSRRMLPAVEAQIAEGDYHIRGPFAKMRTKEISLGSTCFGEEMLRNINTPEEYRKACMPYVFCVSGYSGSGKTTLVTKLIQAFREAGMTAAVIKHDGHDRPWEREGSDTARFLEAGACGAAIFSDSRWALQRRAKTSPEDLIRMLKESADPPDVILLEGLKFSDYPHVEVVRKDIFAKSVCPEESLICIVSDCIPPGSVKCPVYGPDDIGGIFQCVMELAERGCLQSGRGKV